MKIEMLAGYRATMFDGDAGLDWLRHGWRGLRLYGRKAKAAILAGNHVHKAEMIDRADRLLALMAGILDTGDGATLGPLLMTIYAKLHMTLLRANVNSDTEALDEFEQVIDILARDMLHGMKIPVAA